MIRNGIDLDQLNEFSDQLISSPNAAAVCIQIHNRWQGGYAVTSSTDSLIVGEASVPRNHSVQLDLPAQLGGSDTGPTPNELMLMALGSCVAHRFVEQAGVRGVNVSDFELTCEGHIDLRGALDVAGIRPGLSDVHVRLDVRSNADDILLYELLAAAVHMSPIADSLANVVEIQASVRPRV